MSSFMKISQITPASSNPALTDQVIGIGGGTNDYLYTLAQLAATISPTPPNLQTGTSYTLALTDLGGIVEMSNTGSNIVTVPNNATIPFPAGTQIDISQIGTGATTIASGLGVTILAANSLVVPGKNYTVTLYQRNTLNTWVLNGAL